MKYIRSTQGYTLLLTLILVVLLLMITATFTMASMNQAKQVVKTDDSIVATSMAEMGVEHYTQLIDELVKTNTEAIASRYSVPENNKTYATIRQEQYTIFTNEILSYEGQVKNLAPSNHKYTLTDVSNFVNNNQGISFSINITGTSGENSTTIKVDFSFNNVLNPLSVVMSDPSPQNFESFSKIVNDYPEYVEVYDSGNYANHVSFPANKILYFSIDTTFGQAFNDGMNGNKVYSVSQLLFLKHTNFTNVNLEANNLRLDFNNTSQSFVDSSIFIVDSLNYEFNGSHKLPVRNKSKICIRNTRAGNDGFLSDTTISSNSWVYFYQVDGQPSVENTTTRIGLLTKEDFKTKCSFSFSVADYESDYGDILDDITYN